MRKVICLMLAILVFGSCAFAEEGTVDYKTGTPWLCIDLEGVVTADTPASPKDNYALWANKDAILALEIPEGYSDMGTARSLMIKQRKT